MEIRHVPSYYDKNQIPSLTYIQLVLFDKVYTKQVSGPPTTSWLNEYNIYFPIDEEGKVDAERDVYDTKNKSKRAIFKYEQEGKFCIGVAKAEIKED